MKTYYILWTYIANYSELHKVRADSPELAIKSFTGCFSEDFQKKAKIYVFDAPPIMFMDKGDVILPKK